MKTFRVYFPYCLASSRCQDAIMHPKRTMGRIAKSLTLFIYLQMISALVI